MLLLFDTSHSELHIGIANDAGAIVGEYHGVATKDERGIHDSRLASETANLLSKNRVSREEITRLGLIIGPGSFTGLRIGLAFAKGFCFGSETKIVPVTQHEVLAHSASKMGLRADFFVTLGYQRDLVYVAKSTSLDSIELMTVGAFIEHLGNGHVGGPSNLPEAIRALTAFAGCELSLADLGHLVADFLSPLESDAISTLEPHYVTPFTPG